MKNKTNMKWIIIGVVVVVVAIVALFILRPEKEVITFNEKMDTIEYGDTYEYKDMVEKLIDEGAKITYPELMATEVGSYKLPFKSELKGKKETQFYEFKIEDTKRPNLDLYINDENVQVSLNTVYNPITNIKKIKNAIPEVSANVKGVGIDEYKAIRKDVKKANKKINERTIKKASDIKELSTNRNLIFYTTDVNTALEGAYSISLSIVDENYNMKEYKWKLDVVPVGTVVNSGGEINCEYIGSELPRKEGITVEMLEKYIYNPLKIADVTIFDVKMELATDYQSAENVTMIEGVMQQTFGHYQGEKGVSIETATVGFSVQSKIVVNLKEYDFEKDPLSMFENWPKFGVNVERMMKNNDSTQYVCQIK